MSSLTLLGVWRKSLKFHVTLALSSLFHSYCNIDFAMYFCVPQGWGLQSHGRLYREWGTKRRFACCFVWRWLIFSVHVGGSYPNMTQNKISWLFFISGVMEVHNHVVRASKVILYLTQFTLNLTVSWQSQWPLHTLAHRKIKISTWSMLGSNLNP